MLGNARFFVCMNRREFEGIRPINEPEPVPNPVSVKIWACYFFDTSV